MPKLQISREQLADRVAERFPLGIRLFGAFTLVASSPRLNLLPQNNRIGTEVDLRAGEGSPPGLPRGVLGVSYGLRYQADDASVRLTAVRAERIEVGPVSLLQQQAGPAAAAIVGEALTDLTVYTLSAAQRQLLHGLGMEPDSFTVTNEGVVFMWRGTHLYVGGCGGGGLGGGMMRRPALRADYPALLGAAYIPPASPRLPLPETLVACERESEASLGICLIRQLSRIPHEFTHASAARACCRCLYCCISKGVGQALGLGLGVAPGRIAVTPVGVALYAQSRSAGSVARAKSVQQPLQLRESPALR
ncbi:MAG: hypothetical protein AB7F71_25845 [Burkholderiaceae bacterium]